MSLLRTRSRLSFAAPPGNSWRSISTAAKNDREASRIRDLVGTDLLDAIGVRHQPRAERPANVAGEIVDAVTADRQAEVLRGDVLELMRLVDDREAAARDHLPEVALAHGGVGAQQMMIYDHDVGLGRALAHADDEAVLVTRALHPHTVLGCRRDVVPERQVFGEVLDLGAVASLGRLGPLVDHAQVVDVAVGVARTRARGLKAGRAQRVKSMQAEVVPTPLHVGRGKRDSKAVAQNRKILEEDLLLQILGAGRHAARAVG